MLERLTRLVRRRYDDTPAPCAWCKDDRHDMCQGTSLKIGFESIGSRVVPCSCAGASHHAAD